METCDVLVIGCGIAGATAAWKLAQAGLCVAVLTSSEQPELSNSSWAQGGIVFQGENDSPELLKKDIYEAGCGLCNPAAVEFLVQSGPTRLKSLLLEEMKIPFDRTPGGHLCLTEEAAHSMPRILHCKDQTGQVIMDVVVEQIRRHPNITLYSGSTAIDLITLSHHSKRQTDIYLPSTCVGAYVFDQAKKEVKLIFAKETILATGGLSELYLHTTNPKEARGDGIAMAYRAGARIMNMEYIQFHPTTLYQPHGRRFLLSEALRGEGAKLFNSHFEPFVDELKPRDIVSRALFSEMVKTSADHLWLDISHKNRGWIKDRFPLIYETCLGKGFDLSQGPVPIVPAAHYSCGGIAVDLHGKTSIQRLRAIGEVACSGLHGANRLASTSLLEGLVWGDSAAQDLLDGWASRQDYFPPVEEWQMSHEKIDFALIQQDWTTIKQTMWNYVGLVREKERLRRALKILQELRWDIDSFYEKAELTSELIGLRNGILTAMLIAQGAWRNKNSIGCHYRIS